MSEGAMAALDEVYAERNAVVLAFATMVSLKGWTVGRVTDPNEPDWPVLLIDTPNGQLSWHFKAGDLPDLMPDYPGEWDGHDTPEKYRRLAEFVECAWAPVLTNSPPSSRNETS